MPVYWLMLLIAVCCMAGVVAMQCWLMLLPRFLSLSWQMLLPLWLLVLPLVGLMYHLADVIAILMMDVCYTFMLLCLADVIANVYIANVFKVFCGRCCSHLFMADIVPCCLNHLYD